MTRWDIVDLVVGAILIIGVAFVLSAGMAKAAECRQMKVSWYGLDHHGRKTASGVVFDQWGHTAAMMGRQHLGERWRVFYGKRKVDVKVTDTGDFAKYGRGMDLSRGAFRALAPEGKGVIPVKACRLR